MTKIDIVESLFELLDEYSKDRIKNEDAESIDGFKNFLYSKLIDIHNIAR